MKVKAEIRDFPKVHRDIALIITVFAIHLAIFIGTAAWGAAISFKPVSIVLLFIEIIILVPLIIILTRFAHIGHERSWTTGEFDLQAKGNRLYYRDIPLHVNYNSSSHVIYAHDLGDHENPTKATIYLTIDGQDRDNLRSYLQENGIPFEEEKIPEGKGKYRVVTEMGLFLSKYRRR